MSLDHYIQPTKSGTPHFHLILFAKQATLNHFQKIYENYCNPPKRLNKKTGIYEQSKSKGRRDDFVKNVSINARPIQSKPNKKRDIIAAVNYITRVFPYTTSAKLNSSKKNKELIYEAECISAFASEHRIRLIRYSKDNFSNYRLIRKAFVRDQIDSSDPKIAKLLDTFTVVTNGKRQFKSLDFYLFEKSLAALSFSKTKEQYINRFKEKAYRLTGILLEKMSITFKAFDVIPI